MLMLERKKKAVAWLSVASNTILTLGKLIIGLTIGSVSVISEAIHSGVDLLAAIIALFAVHAAIKPPDRRHPFGHGKFENISGTVEALLIFLAAGWIIYEAVQKLIHPTPLETLGWGVGVMLFSSVVNLIVSQLLFKVGREADSVALQADGWHLRTDVYTSAGVMTGLAIIWIGGRLWPTHNLLWLDPVAAIAVALLIVRAAWHLTKESARDLVDVALPPDEHEAIVAAIQSLNPTVRGYHHLHTRKSGPFRFIEFHLLVDPAMSVEQSHAITEQLEDRIKERLARSRVTIHIEPCYGECRATCGEGCLLRE